MPAPASCAPAPPARAAPARRGPRPSPRAAERGAMSVGLALGLGLAVLAAAGPAAAQLNASLGVVSDYRLRGVPLTQGRPAVTLDVGYDHSSGAYAGATVIGEDN